ncbi:MAG: putative 2-hydroxyglutaryl-CoA dehydratase [Promethearchaeota archaeon]|nr:MAG: putative 2-hydroxyglutaryl-CoA dehydratase [Candidatus Lokiarchaeota archaeon]
MNLQNDAFLKIADTISNDYIKNTGKKVAGYYCTYIPEELLDAANLYPYRIRATGNEDTDLADTYMVRFTCSFVRSSLNLAIEGVYDFLDSLFICNSCDHSRRMFELYDIVVFKRNNVSKNIPRFYISIPHIISPEGFLWLHDEIKELKKKMEHSFDITITDESLENSISLYNQNRELLRQIYKLRELDKPKITGSDALRIMMANSSVPKDIANIELKRILKFLETREPINIGKKKRILLLGSIVDNMEFMNLVENSGAIIISDNLCFGNRTIIDDVKSEPSKSPLERITERLYYKLSCPRVMDDHERRFKFVKQEINRARIDGVILQRINNCDLHGCDNNFISKELKKLDIPVYNFDRENFQSDTTRLKTRLEAFIEMMN